MADRLSSLDTSFLHLEDATTPMHVGSVMVFDAPTGGFDYESLVTLISQRIAHVPRYRQRIKTVPGGLANPVWVDDTHFDMSYHVRRSALPRPGSDEQLEELVARIQPRPLDRSRPLWEVYLVEGLAEDRFAIITKTHHSLVDGISAVDIGNVLVDGNPTASEGVLTTWRARPEPSGAELVVAALSEAARTPSQVVETIQHGVTDVTRRSARWRPSPATSSRPWPASRPGRPRVTAQRHGRAGPPLRHDRHRPRGLPQGAHPAGPRLVRRGGDGQRRHPRHRSPGRSARGCSPAASPSTRAPRSAPWCRCPCTTATTPPTGAQVTACFVDLPVGEPGPSMRLHQIAFSMRQQMEGGSRRAVSADTLSGLGGFAPPTMHALGARLGGMVSRRLYNVVITNVPGPQTPLYAAGARMVSTYPVTPLGREQALSIGADLLRRRGLLRPLRRPRRHAGRRRARPRRRRRPPRAARGPARRTR